MTALKQQRVLRLASLAQGDSFKTTAGLDSLRSLRMTAFKTPFRMTALKQGQFLFWKAL
jgi:hypothetical protein